MYASMTGMSSSPSVLLCSLFALVLPVNAVIGGAEAAGPAPAVTAIDSVEVSPMFPVYLQSKTSIIIEAPDGIEITQKEFKEWYQKGLWPLIGSTAVTVLGFVVTISVVFIQSRKSFRALLVQIRIDILNNSLGEFYNPLLALLEINSEIFRKTGPSTFPDDENERSAASLVWNKMKKSISKNNDEIENIIKSKSHSIHHKDSFDFYRPLLLHVAMYRTFQALPTDLYGKFRFPHGIHEHVKTKRESVIEELQAVSRG
jgi:hypothetical protein